MGKNKQQKTFVNSKFLEARSLFARVSHWPAFIFKYIFFPFLQTCNRMGRMDLLGSSYLLARGAFIGLCAIFVPFIVQWTRGRWVCLLNEWDVF